MQRFDYPKADTVEETEFLPYNLLELDSDAILALATTLHHGAMKYGSKTWHKIPLAEHVNHAMAHLLLWANNDNTEEHLHHAFARMMMAVALDVKEEKNEGRVHHAD